LAVTATTRLPATFTLRTGANRAGDVPNAAEDDNLLAAAGAATMDADAIAAAVAAILIELLRNKPRRRLSGNSTQQDEARHGK